MRPHSSSIGILAIACGLLTNLSVAQAGIETWVSGIGTDTGTCPITAPCRTFAYAHSQTNASGAINVLSSGNFGPVTITKQLAIVAQGVEAVINNGAGGAGIIVQAGGGATVSLRGLSIDMRGTDNHGILFLSGAALHLRDCMIRRSQEGIRFTGLGAKELYVADSAVEDSIQTGIRVSPTGGSASVVLNRVRVENGFNGILFESALPIKATVRDSVSAGNSDKGLGAAGNGVVTVMVERTSLLNNGTGLAVFAATSMIRIGDSTVTGNGTGLNLSGGQIISFGTNRIEGNTVENPPSDTIVMK